MFSSVLLVLKEDEIRGFGQNNAQVKIMNNLFVAKVSLSNYKSVTIIYFPKNAHGTCLRCKIIVNAGSGKRGGERLLV